MRKLLIIFSIIGFIFAEGEISGVTYFDYSATDTKSAFNMQRQYFGYSGEVSDKVSYKILFDVGRTNLGTTQDKEGDEISEDTRLVTFLKKAQVNYKSSFGKFNFGLIGMNTYVVQESNWGYRFIEKSALDKYGFSGTADIGVGVSRSLIDNLNLSLLLVNGEGFKKPQMDEYHKIAFNATYGESKLNKNDGYNAGIVYTTESTDADPITMASVFGGFARMGLRLGGEYDLLIKGSVESNIISVNANYTAKDNIDIFARYDIFDDNDNTSKNGKNYLITGIILACEGDISVAPNIRIVNYENTDKGAETEYKVNFQFKL